MPPLLRGLELLAFDRKGWSSDSGLGGSDLVRVWDGGNSVVLELSLVGDSSFERSSSSGIDGGKERPLMLAAEELLDIDEIESPLAPRPITGALDLGN